LDEQLETCEAKCYVLQDLDWIISSDTVVRPDVMVVCDDIQNTITRPPEVIFEIVSEKNASTDERYKFELYQKEGVRYYVLCYPALKKAKVYRWRNGKYIKEGDFREEIFRFETSCSLSLEFKKIWFK
ncbi:MAG: Uma2 family endonuclease, partial [Dissulfurimicrobium sp.]